jgi:Sigma-54 interaction domain
MAQSFKLAGRGDRSPDQRAFVTGSDNQRRFTGDEELARLTELNLLIMGADEAVARFVTSLWPSFVTPSVVRRRGEPLELAQATQPAGTIIVHDVHTLTRREQQALYRWMNNGNGDTRVVSTTTQSLLPLLAAGLFDDVLYYRLNVLTVDLTPPVAQ